MKIKIRSPSFCKDTLDDFGDVMKRASWLLILWDRPANLYYYNPSKYLSI